MEEINLDKNSMLILIKGNTKREVYYQVLPIVTYSGRELFPYEDKSLFNQLNTNESFFDVIIIGKIIVKQQIDSIKNEILQKIVCDIKSHIFEYGELINDNIKINFDYNNIIIEGYNGDIKTKYILQEDCWIEKTENFLF
tara:strand:+ start:635 stop:1054 length:420 start_codon:yes stop_codon:yes gene_type:complete